MNVYIGSDHAGFALKEHLVRSWSRLFPKYKLIDVGPTDTASVDYPAFADRVAQNLLIELKRPAPIAGILICGSGQGMAMRANRYPELRAAVCQNLASAQLAREHNDANVLCLGARVVTSLEAEGIVEKFFTTSFQGGRHSGRVHSLSAPLRAP